MTAITYVVVAAVITLLVASAFDLPVPLGVSLSACAAAVCARVAPPQRVSLIGDSLEVEGWRTRQVVHLSDVAALAISWVRTDPPTLELIHAHTRAIGPISLEESTRPFLRELVVALDTHGPSNDRYIRENLTWLRRFAGA
ncbi:hypothetical protein UB45_10875 [Terrabacter sp. 28]|nr:hypothetical protein UB45_10875 [Terrabacter sp. 28]